MSTAKYHKIAAKICTMIDQGTYPVGEKLPTHRVLAAQLKTTAVTVSKAYKLLVEQQKIESFVGRGSYVSDKRLQQVIQVQQNDTDYNFSILQPCLNNDATLIIKEALQHFSCVNDPQFFGYTENTGLEAHRLAGAKWCQYFGLDITAPADIILTNGAQNALSSVIQLYSKEGDCIAVEAQTYPGVLSICKYLNRKVVPIAMDEQGMLPQALDSACDNQKISIVVIVPAQQNPIGATMLNARRKAIAKVIKQQDIWLIEDDIYAFLNEQVLKPITNYVKDKAFYINALSKALLPSLRCGYLKAPPAEHAKLVDFIRSMLWLPSAIPFEIASYLINSDQAFKYALVQKNKAQMRQLLVDQYLPNQRIDKQKNSYSCWLYLPKQWTAKRFTLEAKKRGLLVSDASYFDTLENSSAVRLSVMSISQDDHFISGLKHLNALLCVNDN